MRAIWLLNTIEVELSRLGIPLMRVPPTLRELGNKLAQGDLSEQDRELIDDDLCRAHALLAQAVGELQAGMAEIESILRREPPALPLEQSAAMSSENVVRAKGV